MWATNLDQGTIVRIPLHANGKAGPAQVAATGLAGIDDFAFTGNEMIAALNTVNQVALVKPDGKRSVTLTGADGLQDPTTIAVRGRTVSVLSAAYLA